MPKPPAPPLPTSCTNGQLAKLLGASERVVAGRRLDGRLPVVGGGIDLAAVIRHGVDALAAQQRAGGRAGLEEINREAFNLAAWAGECVACAIAYPREGEALADAARRGLSYALRIDDYFLPPPGWTVPVIELDPETLPGPGEDEAGAAEAA